VLPFPFWEKRLQKQNFFAYQVSLWGGFLRVMMGDNGRVRTGGQVKTVWNGNIVQL
jgi:hypothetical protein